MLLTERSDTWVPLHHELTFLQRSPQFIWASSRDGFQHLYLYGNDGKLIRQLTSGEFMVMGESPDAAIRAVDERARRVYFMANLPSPIERQLYWVSLDAPAAPQRVTAGAGWHSIAMSKDARVFVDTFLERRPAAQRHAAHAPAARRCRRCWPTSSMPRIRTRRISTNT